MYGFVLITGEDRWLCTLMLKEGFRVEYCAASDALTFAPEGFFEFYKQRRRWAPSTMANILDLLLDWKYVKKNNDSISMLYIIYHIFLFVSSLLTPGTIFLLIMGAIITAFPAIQPWLALVLNMLPVGVLIVSIFLTKEDTQVYNILNSSLKIFTMYWTIYTSRQTYFCIQHLMFEKNTVIIVLKSHPDQIPTMYICILSWCWLESFPLYTASLWWWFWLDW